MNMLNLKTFNSIITNEPVFQNMRNTSENSPYHRESNVFVHTMMVCDWYDTITKQDKDYYFLGLFACLLHDVAKPICRVRKENEMRGVYYSYDKHDIVGAELSANILLRANVNEFDIYRICWMVEHHQIFWATKKIDQQYEMKRILISRDFYLSFKYFMISDDMGRICDTRTVNSEDYFNTFENNFNIKII